MVLTDGIFVHAILAQINYITKKRPSVTGKEHLKKNLDNKDM